MKKPFKYIKTYIFIFIALVLLATFFIVEIPSAVQPVVKQGYLELSSWDFEQDGIIALDGKWEFYWNKLLTYDDFHAGAEDISPDGYVPVPGVWNTYNINGETLPGEGCATYRLRIKSSNINTEMGLKIANMATAYKLFVNNETIASNGTVSDSPENAKAEFKPQVVVFKTPSGDYEIIMHISNYTYARGGLWYSIFMGTSQQIQAMKENALRREMFIFGGIIMMMLYHLAIYIFQRKNISILYYVLMMLIIAARIPVTGEYMISELFHDTNIRPLVIVEYLTICWAPVTWILFINRFYPEEISKKVVHASVYVGTLLSVFTLLVPIYIFTAALLVYELIVVVLFIYALQRFVAAVARKREGIVLMLLATAAFFGTFVNDALYQWNIISSRSGGIFGFSAFVIIFIQAYVLAAQFSRSYREVAELSDRLLSLDRLKDEFLANTSHELRTPLNGIINITNSVIRNGEKTLDADQCLNLKVVVSAAKRLHSLINDILDISSLKNGEIRLKIRPVDLSSVASLTVYELQRQKCDKEIEFLNSIPADYPPVDADVERLRQIFYNLIGNALKFTQTGSIEVGATVMQDKAEIWVRDTGCGISKDQLKEIFKPFYQVDSAETRESGGTGLGLSITKKLIELHRGEIHVTSEVGSGSRFVFTLPLSKEPISDAYVEQTTADIKETSVIESTLSEGLAKGKYLVLVAEDDYTNLRALMTILGSEDYYIKAVNDGHQVLGELDRQPNYDLLILDVMMPKLSGYQVLEAIRKRFTSIELPVILLTAKARQQDIQAGFDLGANDYIAKPFEADELKSRVSTLVQLKRTVNSLVSAELNFLQAQIKPHFLYNALSVITSLSIREPKQAKTLLMHLSDYLRGSFNFENHSGLVSLSDELQTVKAYLSIEEARFEERLRVEYDVEPDISASIPILCLQPIVENAVRHGIIQRVEGGTVRISVKAVDTQVVISVEDDGVGMTQDRLAELFEAGEAKGVGIRNIQKRMLAMYGHGLIIESTIGQGTKVTMTIPNMPVHEVEV
ncbi:MAG: ATP-binding protein [Eubacteriales bacterium]